MSAKSLSHGTEPPEPFFPEEELYTELTDHWRHTRFAPNGTRRIERRGLPVWRLDDHTSLAEKLDDAGEPVEAYELRGGRLRDYETKEPASLQVVQDLTDALNSLQSN